MSIFFLKIYRFFNQHKYIALALLLALTGVFALLALHIHYEEDIAKFLPKNEKTARFQNIYQKISAQDRIIFLLTSKDSAQKADIDTLEEAMDELGETLESKTKVKNLQVTIDEIQTQNMLGFILQNAPYFLTEQDYQHIDSLLANPDYVEEQMTQNVQLVQMPMNDVVMETVRHDPAHLFNPLLQRLKNLKIDNEVKMRDGYLFTADEKYGMITCSTPYGSSETQKNALLADDLQQVVDSMQNQYPTLKITMVGAPLIAVTNANQIKSDSMLSVAIAVFFILALLLWHYRRIADMLWIGCSLAFGWLFALAGMALFKDSISIIVLGIGSVIIGIAVNYPLHFLDHIREEHDRKVALKEMVPPLLIGNITTVAAFFCLIGLDAQAMRDLGLFGSLMLIGTILFVLVFLPVYAQGSKLKPRAVAEHIKWNIHIPHLLPLVIVITIILGYFSLSTSFDSNLQNINYMTSDQKHDLKLLAATVKEAPVYMVAEGKSLEEALQQNEKLIDTISQQQEISHITGIGDFVPSRKRQEERLKNWNAFKQKYAARLKDEIIKTGKIHDFDKETFAPFLANLDKNYTTQPIAYFKPIVGQVADSYILQDKTGYQVVNYVYTADKNKTKAMTPLAFSSEDLSNQLVTILNDSFNYIGIVCGFIVFLFLWISFGSIELSALSFLPLAISWIWILGIMQLFGIQFNIVNIILASFIFGQGDDYTIFITEGLMYEYTTGRKRLESYKNSVMISAILMFIGIGCLVFAKHPALQSLGAVTIIGMITVVMMAYYLPPLVFHWLTMKHGAKREVPLTLKRLIYSGLTYTVFAFVMLCIGYPYTWFLTHLGKMDEKRKLKLHHVIQYWNAWAVRNLPGVKFNIKNKNQEDFSKPAIIICNHQSHLDLITLLQLSPKMVFLTKDWVWNNAFFGPIIRHAEFYPITNGVDDNMIHLNDLFRRGYSICIFPEGTRSSDCHIQRFHKGAFLLAQQLKADILPLYLHGAGHVMPKYDHILRNGQITLEIGDRIPYDASINARQLTQLIHKMYQKHYAEMQKELETEQYWSAYEKYRKIYQI